MVAVGSLKRGHFVLLDGEPFKVDSTQSVVTGKHSHTKMKVNLTGVFNGAKRTLSLPPHKTVETADVNRKRGQLISKISEDVGQIMDLVDYKVYEARVAAELMAGLKEGDEVTYVEYGDRVRVLGTMK